MNIAYPSSKQLFIELNSRNKLVEFGFFEINRFSIKKKILGEVSINEVASVLNNQYKNPLFYIHGFYSATKEITSRTVKGFDLFLKDTQNQMDAVVHIIWNARTLSYKKSLQIISESRPHLGELLDIVNRESDFKVNLMCHSMGNRFLLETMIEDLIQANTIDKLILSAADISFEDFQKYQNNLLSIATEIIILTHKYDVILAFSQVINQKKRLGQQVGVKGLDRLSILDCTKVSNEQNLLSKINKHFYFVASTYVRDKIHLFLRN